MMIRSESLFMQAPLPFGKHSTSYRSVHENMGSMRGASSMLVLNSSDAVGSKTNSKSSSMSDTESDDHFYTVKKRIYLTRPSMLSSNSSKLTANHDNAAQLNEKGGTSRSTSSLLKSDGVLDKEQWFWPNQGSRLNNVGSTKFHTEQFRKTQSVRSIPIQIASEQNTFRNVPSTPDAPFTVGYSQFSRNDAQKKIAPPVPPRPASAVPFARDVPVTIHPRESRDIFSSSSLEIPISSYEASPTDSHADSVYSHSRPIVDENNMMERTANDTAHAEFVPYPRRTIHKPLQRRISDPVTYISHLVKQPQPSDEALQKARQFVNAELEHNERFRHRAELLEQRNAQANLRPTSFRGPHLPRQSPTLYNVERFLTNIKDARSSIEVSSKLTTGGGQLLEPKDVREMFGKSQKTSDAPAEERSDATLSSNSSEAKKHSFTVLSTKRGVETQTPEVFYDAQSFPRSDTASQSTAVRYQPPTTSSYMMQRREKERAYTLPFQRQKRFTRVETAELQSPYIPTKTADTIKIISQSDSVFRSPPKSTTSPMKTQINGKAIGGCVETPASIRLYDEAIDEPLARFLQLSSEIGGDVQTMGAKVSSIFERQRNFIWFAAGQKRPLDAELTNTLAPFSKSIEEMVSFTESKRNTPYFSHLSAISEGIQSIGWLAISPTPAPFINDMLEASTFYVNRVLKESRDGNKVHSEWTKVWLQLLKALQSYVRQNHTTGLVWNSSPGSHPPSSSESLAASAPLTASGGSAPPPPPPPPPPSFFADLSKADTKNDQVDRSALFAEINQGGDITKHLKKVTADMQTHKNPELRLNSVRSDETQQKHIEVSAAPKQTTTKPPRKWLENGKQWNVEYFKDDRNLLVEIEDMKQTLYVFRCEGCVIQVKGKVNSITLDGCKKTSIVFDSLLSQIEIINCQSIQVQTLNTMPTLSIQKTDGCQVYLSKESMNAEIVTSKSSAMNVLLPTGEEGDFVEFPVPEQFKTVFDGKKLHTTVADLI